ncbi:hypothetical protein SBOR_2647 [Sclerotinia borealis F-4128]|uniref:SnoaL-like domain-containing protein n=1 Tax=Sclerotinia borealis (strain F-4128) TaxID=1432307 RepID=W9CR49_SCLBF|nr:hypothetical protein SBOR_2647 [Sclerotinia borealis F-4128]
MAPHNHHSLHTQQRKHGDHEHIMKRLDGYIKSYRSGDTEAIMKYYHPDNFVYSDFSVSSPLPSSIFTLSPPKTKTNPPGTPTRHLMTHDEVATHYTNTFTSFHDLQINTLSLHGHKDFTAWEWEISCKPAISLETGEPVQKEEAQARKVVGCTLMWWEGEKIVRNHDYVQVMEG